MRDYESEKRQFGERLAGKLQTMFGRTPNTASKGQFYEALAMLTRDLLMERWAASRELLEQEPGKELYYLSMEFLMGRALGNNLVNLGIEELASDVCQEFGVPLEEVREYEPDPGLGNGGLGRLAACFLDSLSTMGLTAQGCGIRYENGLFKQKIIDGFQVEVSDPWLEHGTVWEVPAPEETETVRFGGFVEYHEGGGKLKPRHIGYQKVLAVPHDVPILGYHSEVVNSLRLWAAKAEERFDMGRFGAGDYLSAVEQREAAEVISKVLYPEDQHLQGKELRLKQQYFFVSASIQGMVRKFRRFNKPIQQLPEYVVVHINDTHPALAIPELMRILLDEEDLDWDSAWDIALQVFAYTNHTILEEALERWPCSLVQELLPRIYDIIDAINERFCQELWEAYPGQWDRIARMAIIGDDQIRMAHLAIVGSYSVNGVAQLHAEILKNQVFREFHEFYPNKIRGITNGVSFRRFLLKANPELAHLISEEAGSGWILHHERLQRFQKQADNPRVQKRLQEIRLQNKRNLAAYIKEHNGIDVDPHSIFDVHVKRLHEYKRQLMNIMHVMHLYNQLRDNPDKPMHPRTFIFGAKAAPGYRIAKLIIKLIHAVGRKINADPSIKGKLKVVFLEDYRVSLAEKIIPAADVSEQISTAGKEASGTGNMKFMLNGALTVGTLDGANVEIRDAVGEDNIFIFGLTAEETSRYYQAGGYDQRAVIEEHEGLQKVLQQLIDGTYTPKNRDMFRELYDTLVHGRGGMADPYFVLKDFAAYCETQEKVDKVYREGTDWWRQALTNIAQAGVFSSDRTIGQYNEEIWELPQHDFSTYDLSTGLYNHNFMEKRLESMIGNCSVIALDIRRFHEVNRQFNYSIGDRVLRHAAQTVYQAVGQSDLVGLSRTGDLLILLPSRSQEEANAVAQRIQDALAASPFTVERQTINIPVAMALYTSYKEEPADRVLRRLNKTLQQAKADEVRTFKHYRELTG